MRFILFITGVLVSFVVSAQDCAKDLSLFSEAAKVKNYNEALPHYNKLLENCEKYSIVTYQRGALMFKDLLKLEKDENKQVELAQELINNNMKRLALFASKSDKGSVLTEVGQVMSDYNIGSVEQQYNVFDEAWSEDLGNFTNPKSIYVYFLNMVKLMDEGKFELQDVFEKYDEVIGHIETLENEQAKTSALLLERKQNQEKLSQKEERILQIAEARLENYDKIRGGVNGVIGTRADCDNLIPLFEKDFNTLKEDIDWIRKVGNRLYTKECTSSTFFVKVVEQQHKLEPSAKSALYLGKLSESSGDLSRALTFYKQSAELETKATDKAKVYYNIANTYKKNNNYTNARNYFRKAIENQPSMGLAYLKIAEMYAASANDCGKDVFEKKAVYWLAADYAERAASVSPALKSTARQAAESHRGRAPSKGDVFQRNLKSGEKIKLDTCWIGETVAIP